METIYKYNNRKMYSKKHKKYVTQNGYLKQLIIAGADFQILENESQKDVTVNVLQSMLSDKNNLNELKYIVDVICEIRSGNVSDNTIS